MSENHYNTRARTGGIQDLYATVYWNRLADRDRARKENEKRKKNRENSALTSPESTFTTISSKDFLPYETMYIFEMSLSFFSSSHYANPVCSHLVDALTRTPVQVRRRMTVLEVRAGKMRNSKFFATFVVNLLTAYRKP